MAKQRRTSGRSLVPVIKADKIEQSILVVRGQKVLLDEQLAEFYGVETRTLIQSVKRNLKRFPDDFLFQLSSDEWDSLRSQIAISNLRSQIVISSSSTYGGRRFSPYAFTEQGVAMLSSILRSPRAIEVNVQIMRAFVRLRQLLAVHRELADRLTRLEQQMRKRDQGVDQQFRQIFELLNQLFNPPDPPRKPIGFHGELDAPKLPKGRARR